LLALKNSTSRQAILATARIGLKHDSLGGALLRSSPATEFLVCTPYPLDGSINWPGGNSSGGGFWGLMNAFWNQVPWAGAIFIPIPHTVGTVSVMIPLAYIPSTNTSCVGLGLAATTPTGKSVAGGPLVNGNLNNAKNILSGFGYNFGGQATPALGYQVSTNSSGSLGGPTLATSTGLSAGYGYSVCR
jgi:hypothetical protein